MSIQRRRKDEGERMKEKLKVGSNRELKMENGKWRMENGEWKMENGK